MIADSQIEVAPETEGATQLSDSERDLLLDCERRIEDGLESLYSIKVLGLYREYGSWEQYMRQRWGETKRRGDQKVAAYSIILTLKEAFADTEIPIPSTEYMVRPIASLQPEVAVQIYEQAVERAGGGLPTNALIEVAKENVLGTKERKLAAARLQIDALPDDPYLPLKAEVAAGGDPLALLALADTLDSSHPFVRQRMLMARQQDRGFIRRIDELFRNGRDTAEEILTTGYLQFADGSAIKLSEATAKDLQRLTNEKWREHQHEVREKNKGAAVSVVVFNHDAHGTLESLKEVLDEETLLELGRLIIGK